MFLILLAGSFIWGLATIQYKIVPYKQILYLLDVFKSEDDSNQSPSVLDQHFVAKLSTRDSLKYPPIKKLEELYSRIDNYRLDIDALADSFDRIEVRGFNVSQHVLAVTYQLDEKIDTAFAYLNPSSIKKNKEVGILIIPGSGTNQSSAIYYDIGNNYQKSIDNLVKEYGDAIILVKPNEDFLAIHNGKNKISEVSYVNYLLNVGSSYSYYYLVQSMAIMKYIKSNYDQSVVCGLSQGGVAALLNALQSSPDKAVIASGFSTLKDFPYRSGLDQIVIPDHKSIYNSRDIKEMIRNSSTQFLFTWGLEEKTIHGSDAKQMISAKLFAGLSNVVTFSHPGGHSYFEPAIVDFIGSE